MGMMGCCGGGKAVSDDKPEPESFFFKKRGCTDLCCFIFFFLWWAVCGYITYLSLTVGDPNEAVAYFARTVSIRSWPRF